MRRHRRACLNQHVRRVSQTRPALNPLGKGKRPPQNRESGALPSSFQGRHALHVVRQREDARRHGGLKKPQIRCGFHPQTPAARRPVRQSSVVTDSLACRTAWPPTRPTTSSAGPIPFSLAPGFLRRQVAGRTGAAVPSFPRSPQTTVRCCGTPSRRRPPRNPPSQPSLVRHAPR